MQPIKDTDYLETFFELTTLIQKSADEDRGFVSEAFKEQGRGALYELAEDWADEFQTKYAGFEWGIAEEEGKENWSWYDCIDDFFEQKNRL